ncbi:MAG: DEAD/DEAH box helicase [bacterium]|nr:DEAD/DEAH box helicase [bacterium]MDA1024501.1 DEAD/DEAH box helicase [bacterium]
MSRNELQDTSFEGLGISEGLLARLDKQGFKHPTPIQFDAIPTVLSGSDVMGIAQTGSGKTLAFCLPLIQKVMETGKPGLILLPTRELAVQVQETMRKLLNGSNFRTALLIGGVSAHGQMKELKKRPHVIIATPGRLIDMVEQGYAKIDAISVLVLDEADRMLDMGFKPQLDRIREMVPESRQTLLFSATMAKGVEAVANAYMRDPKRIEVAKPGTTADQIEQEIFIVRNDVKVDLLMDILDEHEGQTLVFSRTKHGAKKVAKTLSQEGYKADEIHSNRTQAQRQRALNGFDAGKYRVLVATDIAARGIDVSSIKLVINFDLPDQADDYVHRIGRTGRAGREGKAISFASPRQRGDIAAIQRLIGKQIPLFHEDGSSLPSLPLTERTPRSTQGRGGIAGRRRNGHPRYKRK